MSINSELALQNLARQVFFAAIAIQANLALAQTESQADDNTDSAAAEIEEVVVYGEFISETGRSALKSDVPLRDVPMTVSVYTKEFMNAIEAVNLADLYSYMTGVQRAGNTAYDINIRGFATTASDRNSILVDGLPGLAVRFGSPPTINVQRIAVVKGPASIMYGQIQPGGFVNIITKKPQEEQQAIVKVRGQSFIGGDANSGDSFGNTLSLDSTGSLNADDTVLYRFIAELGDNPGWRDFGKSKSKYVNPSLTVRLSDNASLTGFVEYREVDGRFDDGLVAPDRDITQINPDFTTFYGEPGDVNLDKGIVYGLSYAQEFAADIAWHADFRAVDHEDSRQSIQSQGFRPCHPDSTAGMVNPTETCLRRRQRDQLNKRTYYFVDTNMSKDFELGNITHSLMLGFGIGEETADFKRNDFQVNNDTYDISIADPIYGQATPNPPQPGSWEVTTYDSLAVYLMDQISIGDYWKLVAGLRFEEFDIDLASRYEPSDPNFSQPQRTNGDAISPMAGLLYQPNDEWSLYGSYATSFNPPDPGRQDINGNIFEDPEEGKQYEVGVKADLFDGGAGVTLAVFQIRKEKSLQQTGISSVFEQTGAEESTGFEIEFEASVNDRWQMIGGYSYVDATVDEDVDAETIGQTLRNVAENSASLWNRYQVTDAFALGLGINYIDERYGNTPRSAGNNTRLLLPSYTLVDAAIYYYNDERDINVTLKLENLLDEEYLVSAFTERRIQPGAPANITLSVTKGFGT